ncbi:methylmalonyl-CoA mutase family protein [Cytophagaceae bacterium ABcell3]|nr:methylmalonyl-CoA mutase family protein [Cytophagaceae bacterium ABcell3]
MKDFSDIFPDPSYEQWLKSAEKETGKKVNAWEPYQAIKLLPLYIKKQTPYSFHLPSKNKKFIIRENQVQTIEQAKQAMELGAEGVMIDERSPDISNIVNYCTSKASIHIKAGQTASAILAQPEGRLLITNTGSFIYNLAQENTEDMAKDFASNISFAKDTPFRLLEIRYTATANEEQDPAEELAILLHEAMEIIYKLQQKNIATDIILKHLSFSVSLSNKFFLSLAKIRALLYLWKEISQQYSSNPTTVPIHGYTTRIKGTAEQHYILLSNTIQVMSGIAGGCDSVEIEKLEKHENISDYNRNIGHLLHHEAFFNKQPDPGAGSYYIEQATKAIFEKALKIMKEKKNASRLK